MTHTVESGRSACLRAGALRTQLACLRSGALAALALSACASTLRTDSFHGVCAHEQAECRNGCDEAKNPDDVATCSARCDVEARKCSERAGETGEKSIGLDMVPAASRANLKPIAPMEVSFVHARIASTGPSVSGNGPIRLVDGGDELMPGASVRIAFKLPPDTLDAVLEVDHGAGTAGGACFITVSLGDKAFLARYVTPKRAPDGTLHHEKWEVGSNLPVRLPGRTEPEELVLFIYNNAEAGSQAAYYLGHVTLRARTVGTLDP